jgi:hypothetical protein
MSQEKLKFSQLAEINKDGENLRSFISKQPQKSRPVYYMLFFLLVLFTACSFL